MHSLTGRMFFGPPLCLPRMADLRTAVPAFGSNSVPLSVSMSGSRMRSGQPSSCCPVSTVLSLLVGKSSSAFVETTRAGHTAGCERVWAPGGARPVLLDGEAPESAVPCLLGKPGGAGSIAVRQLRSVVRGALGEPFIVTQPAGPFRASGWVWGSAQASDMLVSWQNVNGSENGGRCPPAGSSLVGRVPDSLGACQ
jgi:hypothetical protein